MAFRIGIGEIDHSDPIPAQDQIGADQIAVAEGGPVAGLLQVLAELASRTDVAVEQGAIDGHALELLGGMNQILFEKAGGSAFTAGPLPKPLQELAHPLQGIATAASLTPGPPAPAQSATHQLALDERRA